MLRSREVTGLIALLVFLVNFRTASAAFSTKFCNFFPLLLVDNLLSSYYERGSG
jgi:hypothetical protein